MYKVRIKKNASPGDQTDYSLHTGLDPVHSPASGAFGGDGVKHTMGAASRNNANIEVEGGETVVGDVNNDGYIEHFEFKGKRHSKGGMPVNIPQGSFIFSDTRKLVVKDKSVLKEVFNKNGKRGGYTPAELSKQYKLNHFMATLRDEKADHIAKGTANLMIQKNMKKLGELALVQESMKGFPTGIPAIAELAMGGGQEPEQGKPVMRSGGSVLPKMQLAGSSSVSNRFNNNENSYASKLYDFVVTNASKANEQQKKADEEWRSTFKKNASEAYQRNKQEAARKEQEASKKNEKEAPKRSSGNVALDKLISEYQRTPTSENAKKLIESIEKSYPFEKGITDFLPWISGTGKYNHNKITGDHKFVEEVFNDALRRKRYDGQNVLSKNEVTKFGKEQLLNMQQELENGKDTMMPDEIAALSKEIETYDSFLKAGDYRFFHDKIASQNSKPSTQSFQNNAATQNTIDNPTYDLAPFANESQIIETIPQSFDNAKAVKEGRNAFLKHNITQRGTPELSADERPVKLSKSSSSDEWEEIARFREGGPTPNERVKIRRNKNTGVYQVVDLKSGNVVFSTYTNPGNKTPGGMDSSYPDMGPEEFVNWFKGWTKTMGVEPNELNGNEDFQERMYNHILENDPETIEKTWNEVGLNSKAMKDSGLLTKLIDADAYNPETRKLDFSKLDPDSKKDLFKEMGTYYKDGMVGVRSLNIKPPSVEETPVVEPSPVVDPVTPAAPPQTKGDTSVDHINPELLAQAPVKRNGPWYIQDQMNLAAAMTDRVNRYEPMLSQIDASYADPVFKDPSRAIAASQEQQAQMYDMIGNSMDPATAAAMAIGSSAEGFVNTANVISQTENENVGIANQFASNNAQVENAAKTGNAQLLQKYVAEMATLGQNTDNANRENKYRTLAAWKNGTDNWQRKKIFEQVLFPQVYQNPINGDIDFSGAGRDPMGMDTYMNPMMGAQNPQNLVDGQIANYESRLNAIKSLRTRGFSDDDIRLVMGQGSGKTTPAYNDRINYANSMMGVRPQNVQLTPQFED